MQSELPVYPSNYAKRFPEFGKPKIKGFIGLENLKFAQYIKNERVQLDLNHYLDKVKRKPVDIDVKLTALLRFLLENELRIPYTGSDSLDDARFFCYRGLMTCVACTPYEKREPWKIVAILYKGNIYLCARDTEEKIIKKQCITEEEKKFTSWGFKFEQYILSDKPNSDPNPNKPVDENEEFSLVFETNLNKHKVVYGAEMDGIRCDGSPVNPPPNDVGVNEIVDYLSNKEFVELKTNRHIEFPNQERNFRQFKIKKWWCQSFLVGISTILCGFRNEFGIVEELKLYDVRELPKMSKGFWEPNVCFNFLDAFLTFVKRCFENEIKYSYGDKALNRLTNVPLMTLQFEWYPRSPVRVTHDYSHQDDPILPEWFINMYGKKIDL